MGNTGATPAKACAPMKSDSKAAPAAATAAAPAGNWKNVMGKYKMDMSQDGLMGAGTSSICRKGKANDTDADVGVKVYKDAKGKSSKSDDEVRLMKFCRQVEVLNELQEPFVKPEDPRLWCPQLDNARPERCFMVLLDSSVDAEGKPGPDAADGVLYVITELAQYSLKDFLAQRKSDNAPISKETVRDMTKALVFVMAGLHAKGFVHLDLKPENLMVFDGALKLIDVDGCVKVGMSIAITNPSISFSPCYCSPEWACFLLAENEAHIVATPGLDVWSVGCTICEFVTLDAILKPMYANFLRHSHSHREAGFLFMDWLSSIKKSPTPKRVVAFDKEFAEMVSEWMLVTDKGTRKTCAECLSSPYLTKSKLHHSKTNPLTVEADDDAPLEMPKEGDRKLRARAEDTSSKAVHTGQLWKLNTGQDGKDGSQWLQRDMWVANNGSLCYFSQKDNKRLVLLDSHKLHDAEIKDIKVSLAKDNAFEIKTVAMEGEDEGGSFVFAAESFEDLQVWLGYLSSAAHMDAMPTMRFDASFGQDLMKFKLSVKNRRMKLEKGAEEGAFEPVFKGTIWKSKANGDIMKETDWFQRDTWLSRNGSLVYYSVREQRELIYYTAADVGRASVSKLPDDKSIKPFAFEVVLPPHEGMEFLCGQFAAESEELRDQWISEFAKFKAD